MTILRARYVFPVDRPPIENGAVQFEGNLVRAVGRFAGESEAIDLGDAAIIPGLVNAHTHLEFSDLERPLGGPGMSLPRWIREVIAQRTNRRTPQEMLPIPIDNPMEPMDLGRRESLSFGVTTVGDITIDPSSGSMWPDLRAAYLELRALRQHDVEPCSSEARAYCEHGGAGLSPHAPYTVHSKLLAAAIHISREHDKPLVMHLAESPEEIQLLQTSHGPFRDLLEERGWWERGAIPLDAKPLGYLKALAQVPRAIIVHGNYLDDDEIAFLAAHRESMSVVYCPRTHAYFRHREYPLQKMLAYGVRLALGTDSRASNPDLDLRKEMQFVVDHHGVSPEGALRLGTIESAAALGLSYLGGTISNGKMANLAIVGLSSRQPVDPHELLFEAEARVVATICRGRVVFSEHPAVS